MLKHPRTSGDRLSRSSAALPPGSLTSRDLENMVSETAWFHAGSSSIVRLSRCVQCELPVATLVLRQHRCEDTQSASAGAQLLREIIQSERCTVDIYCGSSRPCPIVTCHDAQSAWACCKSWGSVPSSMPVAERRLTAPHVAPQAYDAWFGTSTGGNRLEGWRLCSACSRATAAACG